MSGTTGRRWDRIYWICYVLYIGGGMLARWGGWVHGDAVWFVEAGRRVLDGSFDIYRFLSAPQIAPPAGLAFSYSPLVAVIVAPFAGVADALGWGEVGAERFVALPFLILDCVAMDQLRRLLREWRPAVDERFVFLGVTLTLGITSLFVVSAFRAHQEGLILLLLIVTLRLLPRHLIWAGICAGLTLGAKQTAVLELIPIGLVIWAARPPTPDVEATDADAAVEAAAPRGARAALIWSGLAAGTFALLMLPAVLRNFDAVWYAFVTQESRRVLLGPGLPVWADLALKAWLPAAQYDPWHTWLLANANTILVAVAVYFIFMAVLWTRRRGDPIGLRDARLLALIAFGGVIQLVLAKWVSGHYYQLPLALVLLWDLVRTAPRPGRPPAWDLESFPWIGLGAAIAFRTITEIDAALFDVISLKDALIWVLFAVLVVRVLRAAWAARAAAG